MENFYILQIIFSTCGRQVKVQLKAKTAKQREKLCELVESRPDLRSIYALYISYLYIAQRTLRSKRVKPLMVQ